jgi:hypothetical protein
MGGVTYQGHGKFLYHGEEIKARHTGMIAGGTGRVLVCFLFQA